jgi:hypothetical protein
MYMYMCDTHTHTHTHQLSMWKGGSLASIDIYNSDSETEDDDETDYMRKKYRESGQTEEAKVEESESVRKERVIGIQGDTVLQTVALHSRKSANETFMNSTSSDLEKACAYVCVCVYIYECVQQCVADCCIAPEEVFK